MIAARLNASRKSFSRKASTDAGPIWLCNLLSTNTNFAIRPNLDFDSEVTDENDFGQKSAICIRGQMAVEQSHTVREPQDQHNHRNSFCFDQEAPTTYKMFHPHHIISTPGRIVPHQQFHRNYFIHSSPGH
jgi:hypothetical protein